MVTWRRWARECRWQHVTPKMLRLAQPGHKSVVLHCKLLSGATRICVLVLLITKPFSKKRLLLICVQEPMLDCWILVFKTVFTRPPLPEGSSLQVEILSIYLFNCTSSLQNFRSMAFKSSQNDVRPHILYTIGSGACLVVSGACLVVSGGVWCMSGGVRWCQCI